MEEVTLSSRVLPDKSLEVVVRKTYAYDELNDVVKNLIDLSESYRLQSVNQEKEDTNQE